MEWMVLPGGSGKTPSKQFDEMLAHVNSKLPKKAESKTQTYADAVIHPETLQRAIPVTPWAKKHFADAPYKFTLKTQAQMEADGWFASPTEKEVPWTPRKPKVTIDPVLADLDWGIEVDWRAAAIAIASSAATAAIGYLVHTLIN